MRGGDIAADANEVCLTGDGGKVEGRRESGTICAVVVVAGEGGVFWSGAGNGVDREFGVVGLCAGADAGCGGAGCGVDKPDV